LNASFKETKISTLTMKYRMESGKKENDNKEGSIELA
jgi:hypothetical protein